VWLWSTHHRLASGAPVATFIPKRRRKIRLPVWVVRSEALDSLREFASRMSPWRLSRLSERLSEQMSPGSPSGPQLQRTVGVALNEWYQAGYSSEPVYGMPTFSAQHTPPAMFDMLSAVGAVHQLYGAYLGGEGTPERSELGKRSADDDLRAKADAQFRRIRGSAADVASQLEKAMRTAVAFGPEAS